MKRWIRLGAIVVVIAAMVVALILLRNAPDEPVQADDTPTAAPAADERTQLFDNDRDQIERVTVDTENGELEIARAGDDFRPVYPYDVAFNVQQVNRIVSGAASLSSRRTIGEADDLSDFGLADPTISITVALADGSDQSLLVGDMNPARDAYYVRRPGEDVVYTVFNTWINPFLVTLDQLRVRAIPQVTQETLQRVVIQTLDGRTIRATTVPEWDESPELGFAAFQVVEPFARRFQANSNWLEELFTGLGELRIGTFVNDAPTDLSRYGLAPPRARLLVADEENTLDLLVGSPTDGGRYARFADSPSVFVLSGVESLVSVRPYETISAFALILNIDLIDSFTVEGRGASYVGSIERTPVEGEEDPEESYFLGGQQIDEDLFKDLYQWAIGLQFDAEIDPATSPGRTALASREPIAEITYLMNTDPGTLSVSFVPYNDNFAAVVRDDESEFLISRAKLERMLDAFEDAAGNL